MTVLLHTGAIALTVACVMLSLVLSRKISWTFLLADALMIVVMIISAFAQNALFALLGAGLLVIGVFVEVLILRRTGERSTNAVSPSWHRPLCLISMAALVVLMAPAQSVTGQAHVHGASSVPSIVMVGIIVTALLGAVFVSVRQGRAMTIRSVKYRLRLHHGVEAFGMIAGASLMLTAFIAG